MCEASGHPGLVARVLRQKMQGCELSNACPGLARRCRRGFLTGTGCMNPLALAQHRWKLHAGVQLGTLRVPPVARAHLATRSWTAVPSVTARSVHCGSAAARTTTAIRPACCAGRAPSKSSSAGSVTLSTCVTAPAATRPTRVPGPRVCGPRCGLCRAVRVQPEGPPAVAAPQRRGRCVLPWVAPRSTSCSASCMRKASGPAHT